MGNGHTKHGVRKVIRSEMGNDHTKHAVRKEIRNDSCGNSYDAIFGHYLDDDVTAVQVDDPYIRSIHQIYNFLRFCELLVKKCPNLRRIHLTTTLMERDKPEQLQKQINSLNAVTQSLQQHSVQLNIDWSGTLHDREIRLNNGWNIKIGRGLDYFKQSDGAFTIGYCDFDLRMCHRTTVDIYPSKFFQR